MNNKGFTLVELLGIIVLLIIIFALVYPSVILVINSGKETVEQKQINDILMSAYDYSIKNTKYLPERNDTTFITLSELKMIGSIKPKITNPVTDEEYPDDLVISIKNVGSKYNEKSKYAKRTGDYLYTLEVEKINSEDYESNRPNIELIGLDANSSKNYVSTIDVNSNYNEVEYNATDKNGKDITDKVTINILYNDKAVESIDTTTAGIYYINYTVIDDEGYARMVTRSVIITDEMAPTLTVPTSTTISISDKTFDLLDKSEVNCSDNSGRCEITYTGEIKFGTLGKYVIEYTAKDPSGNTTKEKRVITIE